MSVVESNVEDGIHHIRLNRPESLNALNAEVREELLLSAQRSTKPDVAVVLLSGNGRAFTAGMDLREASDETLSYQTLRRHLNPLLMLLQSTDRPIVSVLDGLVVGAGIGIGLSADVRVGGPSTRFLPSFVAQGLVPDSGSTYFATRAMGYDAASRWLLLGEEIAGEAALRAGMLTDFASDGNPMELALELARRYAALPRVSAGVTLSLVRRAARSALAEQLEGEAAATGRVLSEPETVELRARRTARMGAGGRSEA